MGEGKRLPQLDEPHRGHRSGPTSGEGEVLFGVSDLRESIPDVAVS